MSRKSPYSLYSLNIASFTMGAEYDQKDARGFINLIGLPIQVRAAVDESNKKPRRRSGMKLWGGRFEEGPSEVFERFSGSLHFDRRLIDADIRGSQAFARALEGVGILTAAERARARSRRSTRFAKRLASRSSSTARTTKTSIRWSSAS